MIMNRKRSAPRPRLGRRSSADENRVAHPGRIGARPGQRVVQAAALLPLLRAGDDEARDVGQVAQLDDVAGDEVSPVVLLDLADQVVQPALRAGEPLVRAYDADVVPPQGTDLLPA